MSTAYIKAMTEGFASEMKKLASMAQTEAKAGKGILGTLTRKEVVLPAAGAAGYAVLSKAEQDRKLGRQVRKQQGF